jgi:hypothetical protein
LESTFSALVFYTVTRLQVDPLAATCAMTLIQQQLVATNKYKIVEETENTWPILSRPTLKHFMFLRKNKKKFYCGHIILTDVEFLTQLFNKAGISVWRIVWVKTHCRCISDVCVCVCACVRAGRKKSNVVNSWEPPISENIHMTDAFRWLMSSVRKTVFTSSVNEKHTPLNGYEGGTRWHSWLRHWATSWKFAGSIPNSVTGIFYWHNPSGRTMAPGSP